MNGRYALMVPMDEYSPKLVRHDPVCAVRWMGLCISLSLAILCLGIALSAGPSRALDRPGASAPRAEVCGDIPDGVWAAEQSPYEITCPSSLSPDVTLEIQPGVEVRFSSDASLTILGTLHAVGLPGQPITFTSALEEPAPGDWGGLRFEGGSSGSRLAWCVVEHANTGLHIYAGPGETVTPEFSQCTVRKNAQYGIWIEGVAHACGEGRAEPTISGCVVEDNGPGGGSACGIYSFGHGDPLSGCSPPVPGKVGGVVSGNAIRQNHGAGICLNAELDRGSHGDLWPVIEANAISDNAGHGVYFYGDDRIYPRIENNLIYGNAGDGLRSDAKHDENELPIANNTVWENGENGFVFTKTAEQVRLVNNIVAANGGWGLLCNGDVGLQAANNDLWYNGGGDYAGCPPVVSDIAADPQLLDPADGDFRLPFHSPCVDAGTIDGAPATDIDGIVRPQGDGVDIGAHELWYRRTYLPLLLRGLAGSLEGGTTWD